MQNRLILSILEPFPKTLLKEFCESDFTSPPPEKNDVHSLSYNNTARKSQGSTDGSSSKKADMKKRPNVESTFVNLRQNQLPESSLTGESDVSVIQDLSSILLTCKPVVMHM